MGTLPRLPELQERSDAAPRHVVTSLGMFCTGTGLDPMILDSPSQFRIFYDYMIPVGPF